MEPLVYGFVDGYCQLLAHIRILHVLANAVRSGDPARSKSHRLQVDTSWEMLAEALNPSCYGVLKYR